jgi:hypothetical protein
MPTGMVREQTAVQFAVPSSGAPALSNLDFVVT